MRLFKSSDYKRIPWKNGGGMLGDIVASPENADLDAFDWRLSTAHVGRDGPFSVFPGIDRIMKITNGSGLRLEIDGLAPVTLVPGSEPFAFPGDVSTHATLTSGPIDNLNIMIRRDRFEASMRTENFKDELWISPNNQGVALIFLLSGNAGAQGADHRVMMEAGDTLLIEKPLMLHVNRPAAACVIDVWGR
jgi:hypothetical protein